MNTEQQAKRFRTDPEGLFDGQVGVVTGGADGIGRSIVNMLSREGVRVVVFDIVQSKIDSTLKELKDAGYEASGRLVNVTEDRAVEQGMQSVRDEYGRLDIVVNCAGIAGPNAVKTAEVDVKDFDQVYEVNLRGSFLVTKHALKQMLPRNYGRILLFASIAGKEGNAGMSPYSTSKAGVIGFAKAVGKEYAETGITINSVAPAVIKTAMVEGLKTEQVEYMVNKIPMKRCGTLDEISSLVRFIVSPQSSFNTGYCFDMTGGRATY
jgi:3-oxoacyl-[acyl-carrier protein] reductase